MAGRYELKRLCAGLSGTVKLDHNADRIANYRIWHLPKDADAYEDFVDIEMIDSVRGVVITFEYWFYEFSDRS